MNAGSGKMNDDLDRNKSGFTQNLFQNTTPEMSPNLQPQGLTTPFDMSGFGPFNKPGPMQKMDDLRAMLQRSLAPSCIGTSLL